VNVGIRPVIVRRPDLIACALVAVGRTLALHHPFDGDVLEQEINEHSCETLIAPCATGGAIGRDRYGVAPADIAHVIGLWRAPEQVAASPIWTTQQLS